MRRCAPIRGPREKGNPCLRCAICVSSENVERHHVGGRFHIAWFTIPLCLNHHQKITAMLRVSEVDMCFTSDSKQRFIRILQAVLIFLWLVLEWYMEQG
jgi:hypothetical protein